MTGLGGNSFILILGVPLCCQIFPCRVFLSDQPFFLRSIPAFQLFLTINCVRNVVVRLEPNQTMAFVLFAETFKDAVLVLPNSLAQIARHSMYKTREML